MLENLKEWAEMIELCRITQANGENVLAVEATDGLPADQEQIIASSLLTNVLVCRNTYVPSHIRPHETERITEQTVVKNCNVAYEEEVIDVQVERILPYAKLWLGVA